MAGRVTGVKAKAKTKASVEGGLEAYVNRLLTGDDGTPVAVEVETVQEYGDTLLTHRLRTVSDFDRLDFFLPLIFLFAIFALQLWGILMGPLVMAHALFFIVALQVLLVRDLRFRIRRRPSGEKVVGLCQPFMPAAWSWSVMVYLLAEPVILGIVKGLEYLWEWFFPVFGALTFGEAGRPEGSSGFAGVMENWFAILLLLFSAVVFAPITEELWFRGIGLAGFLKKSAGPAMAMVWTSAVFGVLHGPSPFRIVHATLGGVLFALIRFRTGSLYCSIGIHALHNFLVTVYAIYMTFW